IARVRLADETDRVDLRAERDGEPRVVRGTSAAAPGHAEGGEPGTGKPRRCVEETVVGRVGPRPAAFDIIDPELVELSRDCDLIGDAEVHALGLVPVAKGGIEEIDASVGHGSAPSARRMLGWFMATRTPSSRAAGGSAAIHAHGAAATGLDCRVGFGSSRYRLRVAQRLSGCRAWEATSSTPPPGGAAGPVLEVNPLCQQLVANVVGGGEIAVPARLDP